MFVIASNISTRTPEVRRIFRQAQAERWDIEGEPARALRAIAR